MEDFRFKVNLGGMIEILSDHLYSSPDVYIRELLQNGADAITGKKKILGDSGDGAVTLEITEGERAGADKRGNPSVPCHNRGILQAGAGGQGSAYRLYWAVRHWAPVLLYGIR